ncbi:uncharacterized protein G2W53_033372 [Senna tora]|uniref:Uncharacterized protein n=1 Tax=Senna tora TaxID=362788 RepID=A0A834SZ56_9FABA|nr:uncharacterized protein G2W53_033372 [Senna tora]
MSLSVVKRCVSPLHSLAVAVELYNVSRTAHNRRTEKGSHHRGDITVFASHAAVTVFASSSVEPRKPSCLCVYMRDSFSLTRIDDPPIVVPSPPTVAPSPPTIVPSPTAPYPPIAPSPPIESSPPIAPSPHSFVHSNPQHDNEEPQIDNEQPPHLYGRSWGKDPTDGKTWIYPDKNT